MPELKVKITPRVSELLQSGVISITAGWYSSGVEIYGRVTQPHPKLGVYPHESFPLDELESLLEKIRVSEEINFPLTPSSSKAPATPSGTQVTPIKKGPAVAVRTKDDAEIGKVPVSIKVGGVENVLPSKSLCWRDLMYLGDQQLNLRLLHVGREIGADKAVSRVSCGSSFHTKANSLYGFWQRATNEERFLLISQAKWAGKVNNEDKERLLARLGAGQYPFRGTDQKMEEDETDHETSDVASEIGGLQIFDDSDSE